MLNYKNLFKNIYGDILVARKVVMERASELRKKGASLSESLKRAWAECRKVAEDVVNGLKAYKLQINKQSFKIESDDVEDAIDQCLEKIAEVKGKQFFYNVSNNLNERWNRALEIFETKGSLTFAQDVYVRAV